MIEADCTHRFERFASRLTARAAAIAEARLARRVPVREAAPKRWRRADYLWPGFAKG